VPASLSGAIPQLLSADGSDIETSSNNSNCQQNFGIDKRHPLPETYDACADFSRSRWSHISPKQLHTYRMWLFVPNFIVFLLTLVFEEVAYLFYYESEWGFVITTFSQFAIIMAAFPQHKSNWQKTAVTSLELVNGLNFVITPLFWGLFAKATF